MTNISGENITPDKVRKLLAAATPGPWDIEETGSVNTEEFWIAREVMDGCDELIAAAPDIAKAYLELAAKLSEGGETVAP